MEPLNLEALDGLTVVTFDGYTDYIRVWIDDQFGRIDSTQAKEIMNYLAKWLETQEVKQ